MVGSTAKIRQTTKDKIAHFIADIKAGKIHDLPKSDYTRRAAHDFSTVSVPPVPLLQVRGLTRDFGALRANDRVSFDLEAGEVLGIVGENGAGKSTLVKMLAAFCRRAAAASTSTARSSPADPQQAAAAGIGVVHQHFTLIDPLTVEQNLVLAQPDLGAASCITAHCALPFRRSPTTLA